MPTTPTIQKTCMMQLDGLLIIAMVLISIHCRCQESLDSSGTDISTKPHNDSNICETTEHGQAFSTDLDNKLSVTEATAPLFNMNSKSNNEFSATEAMTPLFNMNTESDADENITSSFITTLSYETTNHTHGYVTNTGETMVSSDYVDELLKRNETVKFLNSITNEIKRSVIMNQLKYCPYSKLCTFSFNLVAPKENISACLECSCPGDNSSWEYPCPDILDFDEFGVVPTKPYDCYPMFLKDPKVKPDTDRTLYKTIDKCQDNNGVLQNCGRGNDRHQTFIDILPVTDKITNITYINMPCAICNHVREDDLLVWDSVLSCDTREGHEYTTETNFINFVLDRPGCNVQYKLDEKTGVDPVICLRIIQRCNDTGDWKEFDPVTQSACMFYDNYYRIEGPRGKARYVYRYVPTILAHQTCFRCLTHFKTISIHHEFEVGIEKSVQKITDRHHEVCRVMTIGNREGRIFLSDPHSHDGYVFLFTTKYLILYYNGIKIFQ